MILTYSTTRSRYELQCEYADRRTAKRAGFMFNPDLRVWHTSSCAQATKLIGVADPDTTNRLAAWENRTAAAVASSRQAEAPAEKLAGVGGTSYKPFQSAAIGLAKDWPSVLLGDEPGLGKTVEAIGILNQIPKAEAGPVLVVCQATLKLSWEREIGKWSTHNPTIGIATGRDVPQADVVIVNYDLLPRIVGRLVTRGFRSLIVDEAHMAKNLTWSKRRGWDGSIRALNILRLSRAIGRRLFLTGTPLTSRPRELWPLLAMLDPERWGKDSFDRFSRRYCNAHFTRFGWDTAGSSNLPELQELLRSTVMIRRAKKVVLPELPSKTRTTVYLESPQLEHEQPFFNSMAACITEIDFADGDEIRPGRSVLFEEIASVRHVTAKIKAARVAEFARGLLKGGTEKIIVFAHHKDVVTILKDSLATWNPVTVTGSTSASEAQRAVDGFQNNTQCRVFIGNMQAAGTGLTLTAASAVVFAELDWVPATMSQAEDRAHRIGQLDNVMVYHVVLHGSLDARLSEVLISKQRVMDDILG